MSKFSVESALNIVKAAGGKSAKNNPNTLYLESGALGLKQIGAVDFLNKHSQYLVLFVR